MARRKDLDPRLVTALQRFKLANEATSGQQERELKALKFDAGDQWPDFVKNTRAGSPPGTPGAVAARPMLTIPKLDQPVQQVINQQKNADLGLMVHPRTDASVEDATYRQGIIRQIQVESRAKLARNWAYERAVKVGRGVYKIVKKYVEPVDEQFPFDQELCIERILNQGNVLFDPFAQQPDWSDGTWAHEFGDMAADDFKREFPKAKLSKMGQTELEAQAEQTPGWIGGDEEGRTFRVSNYWYTEYEDRTIGLYELPDGSEVVEEITKDREDEPIQTRVIRTRKIKCCKMTANEILEETEWEGQHIPLIPVIGKEYNLNGERKWMGLVEPAMDAQRLFNYTASAIAEGVALAPKAPFILDPEQIEAFENQWKTANTRNYPYLPRKAFDERGNPYPPIERQTAEPPIQAMTLLLQQADAFIQATTQTPASALGQLDPTHRSGKAVQALQERSELANSNYLDNLANISMTLEGIILNEMLEFVYDRPGRIIQIVGEDDEAEQVVLGQQFVQTPQGPQPPPPVPVQGQKVEQIDLKKGAYHVVVEVGKSFSTRRQESAANIGELIRFAPPEISAVMIPEFIKQQDFPGAQKLAAKAEQALPPHLRSQEDGQQEDPRIQQLQQQLQQMQQMLESKQIEEQAKQQATTQRELAKANTDAQVTLRKAEIDAAVRIAVAKINAQASLTEAEIKANSVEAGHQVAREEAMIGRDQELRVQAIDHQHEREMAQVAAATTAAQSEQEHEQELESGAMTHAQTLEQQQAQPEA